MDHAMTQTPRVPLSIRSYPIRDCTPGSFVHPSSSGGGEPDLAYRTCAARVAPTRWNGVTCVSCYRGKCRNGGVICPLDTPGET